MEPIEVIPPINPADEGFKEYVAFGPGFIWTRSTSFACRMSILQTELDFAVSSLVNLTKADAEAWRIYCSADTCQRAAGEEIRPQGVTTTGADPSGSALLFQENSSCLVSGWKKSRDGFDARAFTPLKRAAGIGALGMPKCAASCSRRARRRSDRRSIRNLRAQIRRRFREPPG